MILQERCNFLGSRRQANQVEIGAADIVPDGDRPVDVAGVDCEITGNARFAADEAQILVGAVEVSAGDPGRLAARTSTAR